MPNCCSGRSAAPQDSHSTANADATYRFLNPVAIRLDHDVPRDILDGRLAGVIRVVLRALAAGSL